MRFLDRLVLSIAPSIGLKRIRARAEADAIMNYDAASTGRRTHGWKSPGTSADSAAIGFRQTLRNLSRDMVRNRAYAARACNVISTNVVGKGIVPSVDASSKRVAERIKKLIDVHLMTVAIDARGALNFLQMQKVVMNTVFTDGEVLVRRRDKSGRFANGLELPFRVELLEADHLDHTITSNGENEVVEGIEYDPVGGIVAYHLYDRHPGDVANWKRHSLKSQRVPASKIIHVRRMDRVGQMRGVPWLAPVMMHLGELSDYQEAQILKQRIGALMAFFVKSDQDETVFDGAGLESVGPGSVVGLAPGQEVTATNPPTVDGYPDFMKVGLRAIAVGIGITYEALSADLEKVNFTSGRMGRMDMDPMVEDWQENIIVAQFCRGVERWFRDYARLTPGLSRADYKLNWTPPRRALVDPTKEIPAALKSIEGGLTSRQREQRRMGLDPDVIRTERAEDAEDPTVSDAADSAAAN